jgi:hypothetical protein
MKLLKLNQTLILALTCILATAHVARAAHSAPYLDPLAVEVSARLETPELAPAQQRGLTSASKTLARNSRTANADLLLLSKAAKTLDPAFPEDGTFVALEEEALNNYIADIQDQFNAVADRIGDSTPPPSLNNLMGKAQTALDAANDPSASLATRARSASLALTKIRAAERQASRLYRAPLSLAGSFVTLTGRNNFTVTLDSNGTYTIPGEPEETGTWTYERTGAKTAVILASPSGGGTHTLNLTFSNSERGKFNGTTAADEPVKGSFTVVTE